MARRYSKQVLKKNSLQEKKIKKEERVMLIEKLSKSSFSSEFMKSSRNLGRGVRTKRIQLINYKEMVLIDMSK